MEATRSDEMTIDARFGGPPGVGNGGYTAGVLAAAFRRRVDSSAGGEAEDDVAADVAADLAAVEVTLRRPPPLGVPLQLRHAADGSALYLDDQVVAEARPGHLTADPVEAVSLADARDAETAYAGLTTHPFPTCFTCGPRRDHGDGLRLCPGRLGDGRTACTWTPEPSLALDDAPTHVRPEFVWAALDCPGGWTADIEGRPMVLGRITAEIDAPTEVGERHVVMGRLLREEGRKTFTTTTLYDSDGRVVARAEHVWFAVDPAAFSDAAVRS